MPTPKSGGQLAVGTLVHPRLDRRRRWLPLTYDVERLGKIDRSQSPYLNNDSVDAFNQPCEPFIQVRISANVTVISET